MHAAGIKSTRQLPVSCHRTHRGQGSVLYFPPKRSAPNSVSRPHPFASGISWSKQQLLQKIPLKEKGFLFTLARRPLLLENKRNLHLHPMTLLQEPYLQYDKNPFHSYSLIKSKPHLTSGTFLQWVYWPTVINGCLTSFNNSRATAITMMCINTASV